MNILFVDDVEDTRDLYTFVLKRHGFHTQTAKNGAEAVAAIQQSQQPFDAVVLDVEMPVMNGWDALRSIRQMPQGQRLPILMFTGYGNGELKERALQAGANRLLHKPLSPDEIIQAITEMCAANRGPFA